MNERHTISSVRMAVVAGMQHGSVIDAVASMESAWERFTGSRFRVCEYTDGSGRSLPCYILTRVESIFVSAWFSRAEREMLSIYWEIMTKN